MSAGMAEVIAAHGYFLGEGGGRRCGKWSGRDDEPSHAAHVAEELAKAGYGLVPDVAREYGARVMQLNGLSEEPQPQGPKPNPSWVSKSRHFRLAGPWQ